MVCNHSSSSKDTWTNHSVIYWLRLIKCMQSRLLETGMYSLRFTSMKTGVYSPGSNGCVLTGVKRVCTHRGQTDVYSPGSNGCVLTGVKRVCTHRGQTGVYSPGSNGCVLTGVKRVCTHRGQTGVYSPGSNGCVLTGVKRVWLQTVDHVAVGLQQHHQFARLSVPHEDVTAVRAAHHETVSPERRLLDLCTVRDQWSARRSRLPLTGSSAACSSWTSHLWGLITAQIINTEAKFSSSSRTSSKATNDFCADSEWTQDNMIMSQCRNQPHSASNLVSFGKFILPIVLFLHWL